MSAPNVSDGGDAMEQGNARIAELEAEVARWEAVAIGGLLTAEERKQFPLLARVEAQLCEATPAPTAPAKFFEEMSNITGQDKVTAPAGDGALPEDVRSFIELVTLHLQSETNPFKREAMFHQAYALYEKYDVEGWRAKQRALTMPTGSVKENKL